jgi:hypothetical protein
MTCAAHACHTSLAVWKQFKLVRHITQQHSCNVPHPEGALKAGQHCTECRKRPGDQAVAADSLGAGICPARAQNAPGCIAAGMQMPFHICHYMPLPACTQHIHVVGQARVLLHIHKRAAAATQCKWC